MQAPAKPPKLSAPIDLDRVRALFADPARVAEADFLRREIASRMFDRLTLVKTAPRQVLDAGCGTGVDIAELTVIRPGVDPMHVEANFRVENGEIVALFLSPN